MFEHFEPYRDSNTSINRRAITPRKYTHVWTSSKIALRSLSEQNSDREKLKVTKRTLFPNLM